MSPVRNGVQWTSRVSPRTRTVALPVATALALPVALVPPSAAAATDYLLMSRSARLARPVTGTAWTTMRDLAQNLGTPDPATRTTSITPGPFRQRSSLRGPERLPTAPKLAPASWRPPERSASTATTRRSRPTCHADSCSLATSPTVPHTLVIKAHGTIGHPTVAIDGT
jgi:hypothetical protein